MSEGSMTAEHRRLDEEARREKNWKRWGPYLAERQWGTVREDYSADGNCWGYFPHEHARQRRYRWGEDGLLGITDRECRLCFAMALWNGKDKILKERPFGLSPSEGNHGEDVKDYYFYLDSTPTHSYMKALYKYPQREFPYEDLLRENGRRSRQDREYELLDTGVFADSRYFDVFVEYAKHAPNDILIRISVANRADQAAELDLLGVLWFRNTWAFGGSSEDWGRPEISPAGDAEFLADHATLGRFHLVAGKASEGGAEPELLATDNETNSEVLFDSSNASRYVKSAFDEYIVHGNGSAVNPDRKGTKAAARYHLHVEPGQTVVIPMRLYADDECPESPLGNGFAEVFDQRIEEADEFYRRVIPESINRDARQVSRQALAGLLWNKQFYYYIVKEWLDGDPGQPPPPPQRKQGRNSQWTHVFDRNVLSVPDKWEFPWFAAWDLGFQMLPMSMVDPAFAKQQLVLLLREWYMHPNGQIPAYEFAFSDVNPPVHAWACWRTYKISAPQGQRDRLFLERTFQKLLLNFTWWASREDVQGRQIFGGGFLGMDNIGVFDRGQPLPSGEALEQADGTAWVAFSCLTMLAMALELADGNLAYQDTASKFFEHFTTISDAINNLDGRGLWDDEDGFYYDMIKMGNRTSRMRVRSLVGLIPLICVAVLDEDAISSLDQFKHRMDWFLANRSDLAKQISYMDQGDTAGLRLLAIPTRERLERILGYLLDEQEFLSPFGIRSVSKYHQDHPFVFEQDGTRHEIGYEPGESKTDLFGGNSNWRGPVWLPINYLIIEALERYHRFYGDSLKVECPTGSGKKRTLDQVVGEIRNRLCDLFAPEDGSPAWPGDAEVFRKDPYWSYLVQFNEYFHGDTGRGCGASHQTGWTSMICRLLADRGK